MANSKNKKSLVKGSGYRRLLAFVGILVIIFAAGGLYLARQAHVRAVAAMPTIATITFQKPRNSVDSPAVMFTVNVKDAQAAAAILNDAHSLLATPPGNYSCPEDYGSVYQITYMNPAITITAYPTGCQFVKVSDRSGSYESNAQFWHDIHRATGKPIEPGSKAKYF